MAFRKNSVPNPLHWLLSQTAKVIWDHKEDGIEQIALPRAIETSVSQLLMRQRGPNMDWGEVLQWRWLQDEILVKIYLNQPERSRLLAVNLLTSILGSNSNRSYTYMHTKIRAKSTKHRGKSHLILVSLETSQNDLHNRGRGLTVFDQGPLNLTLLCKRACLMCIAALPLVLHQLEANRMALRKICGESNLLWQTRLPLKIKPSRS